MTVLKKYLWTIWKCCEEETNDGDSQEGVLLGGTNFFLSGVMGNPQYQYKCLQEIDTEAVKAEWSALDDYTKAQEETQVFHFFNKHMKALAAAVKKDDRAAFEAIVEQYA